VIEPNARDTSQRIVIIGMVRMIAAILMFLSAGCALDPAEREYMEALRGEETGMSRQAQISHIDRAIAQAPDRSEYWETRGIYHIDLREFSSAIADFDRAITLRGRPYLRFLRGLALCQSQAFDRGLEDLEAAVAAEPANTEFYRGRGLARVEVGRAEAGLADGEHLVQLEPHVATSFYVRGKARAALGRHSEAIADFTEAIRLRPELVYPRLARSESYARIGDFRHAQDDDDAASQAIRDQRLCGQCVDPFRY
jgi:tetratricopeptide (TPR) repeat protein